MKKLYLLGNEAIAYGLIEGSVLYAFGYPGTPSSEIIEKLIELSKENSIYVEWSINEKVAYENGFGVSISGKRACVIMKHVGLNVASDIFMTSAYTGVKGGLVLIVADDPSAYSSQNEQDSRRYSFFAKIPCFEPSSPQEAKEMATFSFDFSEKFSLPVMIRSVTRVSHGKSEVVLGKIKKKEEKNGFVKNPFQFVMVPPYVIPAEKKLNEKQRIIKSYIEKLPFNPLEIKKDAKIGVIASGICYQYAKEYQNIENLNFSILKIGTYPIPERKVKKLLETSEKILVFEEVEPVIEEIVYRIAKDTNPNCKIYGKLNGYVPMECELSVEKVEASFKKLKGEKITFSSIHSYSSRPPFLCPGCPHIGSFYLLKKTFGKESIYPGDIGCYTLGIQLGVIDTTLCMGSGIGMAPGIARVEKRKNVVAIIGDSTFFHAGIPGLINACYNRANIVVAILDNRTTAMTGFQPHPGTGVIASGEKTKEIKLKDIVKSCGVDKVITINPYKIKKSLSILQKIKNKKGVKVIIFKCPCVLLTNKTKKKKFYVDVSKCNGCKICVGIGCSAIEFKNEKAKINILCTGCGICAEICPKKAMYKTNE